MPPPQAHSPEPTETTMETSTSRTLDDPTTVEEIQTSTAETGGGDMADTRRTGQRDIKKLLSQNTEPTGPLPPAWPGEVDNSVVPQQKSGSTIPE